MAETTFPLDEEDGRRPSVVSRRSLHVVEEAAVTARPQARGKFIFLGDEKLWVRGVTYGPFAPDVDGNKYPPRHIVEADFEAMAARGVNTVRLYTAPPRWLLDLAQVHQLWAMVGLPVEQHDTFLDDNSRVNEIEATVRKAVKACAGHPALLCYAAGNEIPASIVRWYGRKRIERFIKRLYQAVKEEDPDALVTYVNFPTTEYLDLSFIDVFTFNVYLEDEGQLSAYLKRLHNIAGEKPVVLAEVGLDTLRHGDARQAEVLEWQIRTCFTEGCVGLFIFAWTDDWHHGGYDIENWAFGLTTRNRDPKPALNVVSRTFQDVPFSHAARRPRISVVICSLNGARTIRDSLEACTRLNYPDYEVIVVSDGSTDATPRIAREYDVRLICTKNQGLSAARNVGLKEATGEIIAYIDDDAYPDSDWLGYLATAFECSRHVGVGGPNIPPPNDGFVAACVANAPGGPNHVLLYDDTAEHIPGCNMAFRKEALKEVGGFDRRFRAAGDDVDLCWKLQARGWTIGFHPAAIDWHHRRNSVRTYWRQQIGYGKAEALLEEKWPQKFEALGHHTWSGRIYGQGVTEPLRLRQARIYQGTWGLAPFQSLYQPAQGLWAHLPQMPEWYLVLSCLIGLGILGLSWPPLLLAWGAAATGLAASLWLAFKGALNARFYPEDVPGSKVWKARGLTGLLFLMQPLARLIGRLRHGLRPWRRNGEASGSLRLWRRISIWSERWHSADDWLRQIESNLKRLGSVSRPGGNFDFWDLEIRGGLFGAARLLMAVEEHGDGKQMLRLRWWPRVSALASLLAIFLSGLALLAGLDDAWLVSGLLAAAGTGLGAHLLWDCAAATGLSYEALRPLMTGAVCDPESKGGALTGVDMEAHNLAAE